MTILFEVAQGYLVLHPPAEEDKVKLELPKHLRQSRVPFWVVAVSHEHNDYKAGDKIILKPEAKGNVIEVKLPTSEGEKMFGGIIQDLVFGKVLDDVTI